MVTLYNKGQRSRGSGSQRFKGFGGEGVGSKILRTKRDVSLNPEKKLQLNPSHK